jgi:hypothetical protein
MIPLIRDLSNYLCQPVRRVIGPSMIAITGLSPKVFAIGGLPRARPAWGIMALRCKLRPLSKPGLLRCLRALPDPRNPRATLALLANVKAAFWCRFGLRNMGGRVPVTRRRTHHHLLIDVDEPLDPNEPIPSDSERVHFGAGQTEIRLELPSGAHTRS